MNYDYLTINYAPGIGLALLLIFLLANAYLEKKIKTTFYWLIGLEAVEITVYSLELWTSTFTEPSLLRILFSAIGYSIRPVVVYLILLLALRSKEGKYYRKVFAIPLLWNAVVAFSAFFTDIAYTYSEQNEFVRGTLGYTTHIVAGLYLLGLLWAVIWNFKGRSKLEAFIIIISVINIFISTGLEMLYSNRNISKVAIVLSITFYYMFFQTQIYISSMERGYQLRVQLEQASKTDGLTGLLNKKAFIELAEEAVAAAEGKSVAFIFLDLDYLKSVNDTFGHMIGDKAIKDAAKSLQMVFRERDMIGRFGGDEFCVLLLDIPREVLYERIEEALTMLRAEYSQSGHTVKVTSSIGVAYAEQNTCTDCQEFLSIADDAVYEAKKAGRDKYIIKEL